MFSEHPLSCSLKNSQTSQNSPTYDTKNLSTSNGVQKTLKHLAGSCHIQWSLSSGRIWNLLLGAFAKLRKATINFVMPVCPSIRTEQLCSHWADFCEIWGTTRLPLDGFSRNLRNNSAPLDEFSRNLRNNSAPTGRIFAKFEKQLGYNWRIFMKFEEQLGAHWTDFHEILWTTRLHWTDFHEIWGTTSLPLDGFSRNLRNNSAPTWRIFTKFEEQLGSHWTDFHKFEEQLGSHWPDFHEIWETTRLPLDGISWNLIYGHFFRKSIEEIQNSL